MGEPAAVTPDGEKCGTYAGWNEHNRLRTSVCRPCKRAQADYMRALRKRGRCTPGLGWPLLPGKAAG